MDAATIQRLIEDNNALLIEVMDDQFSRVIEAIDEVRTQVDKIPGIEKDIAELKADMKTVKAAVRDTNRDVRDHETRITHLESTVFPST